MNFNFNDITVKSLVVLFIKAVIFLAIISVLIEILHTVIPVLIGCAVGFGIYQGIKYLATKNKG